MRPSEIPYLSARNTKTATAIKQDALNLLFDATVELTGTGTSIVTDGDLDVLFGILESLRDDLNDLNERIEDIS